MRILSIIAYLDKLKVLKVFVYMAVADLDQKA